MWGGRLKVLKVRELVRTQKRPSVSSKMRYLSCNISISMKPHHFCMTEKEAEVSRIIITIAIVIPSIGNPRNDR